MKKINFILIFILIFSILNSSYTVFAEDNKIQIDFFYSSSCSHCEVVKTILDKYQKENSNFAANTKINLYEIHEKATQDLLQNYYYAYDIPEEDYGKVPLVFIGNKYILGVNSFEVDLLVYFNTYLENKDIYQSDLKEINNKIEDYINTVTIENTENVENKNTFPLIIISIFSVILLISIIIALKLKKE
jgi:glutaredoxin